MRILVIRMDLLGDAIVSGTFLESLKQNVPNLKIDIMCHIGNYAAFKYNPHIQSIYILKHRQGSKLLASDLQDVSSNINKYGMYDLVIVLNGCARTYRYAMKINAKKIIVRKLFTKSFRSNALMFKMKYFSNVSFFNECLDTHEVLRLNDYCQYILNYLQLKVLLKPPVQAKFYPEYNFARNEIIDKSIVINVSGKKKESRYINDSMLYVLIGEFTKCGYNISLVLVDEDLDRVTHVLASFNAKINLINDDNLFNVAKLMSKHQYYIGVDGGLSHVAGGLGLKCIVLFDSQNKDIWHPWTESQISLQSELGKIYDISYREIFAYIND